jgi:hypothetical protein
MSDLSPSECAVAIDEARGRFSEFVRQLTDEEWQTSPVDGDPRPAGVITDHVAHSYEYLAGFITELLQGGEPRVNPAIVDGLNAEHAADLGTVTPEHVIGHLGASGDALISLISGLEPSQLDLGDGQVRRFAVIAARHADSHREEIESALRPG